MIIFRLLALALWVCAGLALAMDIWIMTDTGVFAPKALAEWWTTLHAESLNLFQVIVERHIQPLLGGIDIWFSGVFPILKFPRIRRACRPGVCPVDPIARKAPAGLWR